MAASAAYIPGVSLSDKLRLAASKGQVEKLQELINAGATFEPDREGRTAIHYAALNGQSEIVQILADEGADINAQDALGYTALHRAAAQGHLEVIKVLLVEGCLVDKQDEVHGNSPLHEAAWNGYSKTLELLIRHKANVHCINKAGFTALHLAAQNGHNQSARVLLYAGCNPDMKNNYGDTAIHTAARYGHAGVTRILISARCHVSEQNKNGDTALHIAAALKRRKLTKLLVEAGINTSVKNKQNETAVDVARRKDHPEIIVIITTQLKNSKKSKKNKERDKDKNRKEKGSKLALNKEETSEKKGLFFKKRKSKVSENSKQKAVEAGVRVSQHPTKAPSEVSSSDYNSQMAPEELLHGFRQYQASHRDNCHISRGASTHGTFTKGPKAKVHGLLTEYVPKSGVQYYRDLAGNIRQGPIGYAPVCTCQPAIKKLEKQMEVDRNNLYDHIDTSHKTLAERIESLDKRTAQQVCSVDKLTKEHLEAEKRDREDYVQACLRKDRMEMQANCEHKHTEMKHELKGYLDNRFTNFERYYGVVANRQDPCYWCYGNEHHFRPKYHDDDMLNQNNMVYDPEEPPMPGRLYKSKSDETLSVTSSHPSRRHWKLRTNRAEDVMDTKLAYANERAQRKERKMRSKSAGVSARAASIEQLARCRDGSLPAQRPLHIPEGESGSNLHSEYKTYKDYVAKQHQWKSKRNPVAVNVTEHFSQSQQRQPVKYNSLQRGTSQQVKVEVHQVDRPQSAPRSSSATRTRNPAGSLAREPCGSEAPVRTLDGDALVKSGGGGGGVSRTLGGSVVGRQPSAQRHSSQGSLQHSQSAHSMTADHTARQGFQHLGCYDGSPSQPCQQQAQSQRYAEHARNHVVNTQIEGHTGPDLPTKTSSQLTSEHTNLHNVPPTSMTTTPLSGSLPWNPVHTSSPDVPLGMHTSPNNSDSLMSSQKSSPLYPSPNCAKGTRSESSSNPDSGYGSRLLGGRQVSGPTLSGSAYSSFQSHEHNSSLSTNHSSLNGLPALAPCTDGDSRQRIERSNHVGNNFQLPSQYGRQQQQLQSQQQQQQIAQLQQKQLQQAPQQQHVQQQQLYAQHQQLNAQQQQQLQQQQQRQQQQQYNLYRQQNQQPQHHQYRPQQGYRSDQQQQQQQQQPQCNSGVPGIVNRWYEAKTSGPHNQTNASTRMWPPTHTPQPARNADNDHRENSESGHNKQAGIIGKATQV